MGSRPSTSIGPGEARGIRSRTAHPNEGDPTSNEVAGQILEAMTQKYWGEKGRGEQRVIKYLRKILMVTLFLMLEDTGGKGVVERRRFV